VISTNGLVAELRRRAVTSFGAGALADDITQETEKSQRSLCGIEDGRRVHYRSMQVADERGSAFPHFRKVTLSINEQRCRFNDDVNPRRVRAERLNRSKKGWSQNVFLYEKFSKRVSELTRFHERRRLGVVVA